MKKWIIIILTAALLLMLVFSVAVHEKPIHETAARETWYELTRDDMGKDVLTIRLDSNPTTGFDWSFETSDPELLELLTMEYVSDESDTPVCGLGGTWVASYRNFSGKAGPVTLTLNYARPWEDWVAETRALEMMVDDAGQITIIRDHMPERVSENT